MITVAEALALAEAGFNVRITATTVEILSDAEMAALIAEGDD